MIIHRQSVLWFLTLIPIAPLVAKNDYLIEDGEHSAFHLQ